MRINKYLASCELGSRRKVEEYVKAKKIVINNQVVTDLTYDVKENDIVLFNGKRVFPERHKVYLMLNKPKCYITSLSDEKDRKVVMTLLKGVKEKVFPVGRLDYNTEGMLLLTNDGEWANNIIHPSKHIYKTYEVKVKVILTNKELNSIRKGVQLEGIKYLPAKIDLVDRDENYNYYHITIIEGKNREIRNIFESINVKVFALKRISIGALELGDLSEGKYRYLNKDEQKMVFEV